MSSVSPSSSISQSVSTTGGFPIAPPSEELLNKLEPSIAAKLLSDYYAAIVACSQVEVVGGSEASVKSSRSGSSRLGKSERRERARLGAEHWRSLPGYCYARLLADGRVAACAARLGPYPTLEQVCLLPASDIRDESSLKDLRVCFASGAYHVSDRGSESVRDFLRRCASSVRGHHGVLMGVYGIGAFGCKPVSWGAVVGGEYPVVDIPGLASKYDGTLASPIGSPSRLGYGYLRAVQHDARVQVAGWLGPWPSADDLRSLPEDVYVCAALLSSLGVFRCGGGYHVTYDCVGLSVVGFDVFLDGGVGCLPAAPAGCCE